MVKITNGLLHLNECKNEWCTQLVYTVELEYPCFLFLKYTVYKSLCTHLKDL